MYNYSFLDNFNDTNTIILFHNETDDVERNIIDSIVSRLSVKLKKKYPERTMDEALIALQYPSADSSEHTLNQFFDSPRCASMMFSTFKGIFIVDCSRYKEVDNPAFNKLIDYIKENSTSDFKFMLLLSQQCKKQFEAFIDKVNVKNTSVFDLEITLSSLESYKEHIDEESYNYLLEQYNLNPLFRRLSPLQIKNCVKSIVDSKQDLQKTITITISGNRDERRIGF